MIRASKDIVLNDLVRLAHGARLILGQAAALHNEALLRHTTNAWRNNADLFRNVRHDVDSMVGDALNAMKRIQAPVLDAATFESLFETADDRGSVEHARAFPAPPPPPTHVKIPERKFVPEEQRVPSTPLARVLGFGGLAARVAVGTVYDGAKAALQPAANLIRPSKPNATSAAAAASSQYEPAPPASSYTSQQQQKASPDFMTKSGMITENNAERLAAGLCRMRGAALKVGQMLSIQDESMIPPQLAAVLERVRDQANVMPQRQLLEVLHEEWGADWRDQFAEFDLQPFAAASIGQVHKATLPNGDKVALKIQYPGVADSIRSDIQNLKRLIQVMAFLPDGLFLDSSMKAAEEELTLECDYLAEAENQKRFKALVSDWPMVHVPDVVDELTTKRILVTELIEGVPIDKLSHLDGFDQASRDYVASVLLRLCLRELFEFRFMQTDPNWSNFLYNPQTGVVHLVDFGASRSYSKEFIDEYLRMVYACAERDREALLDSSLKMGFLTGEESKAILDAHVEAGFIVGEPFASPEPFDFVKGALSERVSPHAAKLVKGRLTPPPKDSYTLHRKLSGAFLACKKLHATIPCRDTFLLYYNDYKFTT